MDPWFSSKLKKPLARGRKAWDGWAVQGTGADLAAPVISPQQPSGEGAHLSRLVLQGPFGPGALNHRKIHTEKDLSCGVRAGCSGLYLAWS